MAERRRRADDSDDVGVSNRRRRWHLEPSVSYGHIISTVAVIITLVGALIVYNTRLTSVEKDVEFAEKRITQLQNERQRDHQEWLNVTDQINQKLDRLYELIYSRTASSRGQPNES